MTGGFPSQMASYAEDDSIWWSHHDITLTQEIHIRSLGPDHHRFFVPSFQVAEYDTPQEGVDSGDGEQRDHPAYLHGAGVSKRHSTLWTKFGLSGPRDSCM